MSRARRTCIICGARIRNWNPSPKINCCSQECRDAKENNRTREEQIRWDIENDNIQIYYEPHEPHIPEP